MLQIQNVFLLKYSICEDCMKVDKIDKQRKKVIREKELRIEEVTEKPTTAKTLLLIGLL